MVSREDMIVKFFKAYLQSFKNYQNNKTKESYNNLMSYVAIIKTVPTAQLEEIGLKYDLITINNNCSNCKGCWYPK